MNKFSRTFSIEKAGVITCLFLFSIPADAQDFFLRPDQQKAYEATLRLNSVSSTDASAVTPVDLYTKSLGEVLELLITEDATKIGEYEQHFLEEVDRKARQKPDADYLFVQAEMRLRWVFVYLKFGRELDAATNLNQAFKIVRECRKKYPAYVPIKKTSGLIQVMLGSVPEKYKWLLDLLGMSGSVSQGMADLKSVSSSNSPLASESKMLEALIKGFVFQQAGAGLVELESLLNAEGDHPLMMLAAAALAIKNAESAKALQLLQTLSTLETKIPIVYREYLLGEALLHKGDYEESINLYVRFIESYQGENYVKDAHFKAGLCELLLNQPRKASSFFQSARQKGKEATEADRYAARSLLANEPIHLQLTRARFFTDGGYYDEAERTLNAITELDLPEQKHQVEYYYRKARLHHKLKRYPAARLFYQQTIDLSGDLPFYFAPNACLQIGYLLLEEKNYTEARQYFKQALDYKKHEYKNSIDSKAKSALNQIERR